MGLVFFSQERSVQIDFGNLFKLLGLNEIGYSKRQGNCIKN